MDEEHYPNIVSITPNPAFTEFTVTLSGSTANTYEAMLALSFFITGNKYQIYSGTEAAQAKNIVRYVNGFTEEIISETNSTSMEIK